MTTQPATPQTGERAGLLTIGAVCRRLKREFPEISISKIRYLEDQGLLTPRRTQGGYRLFGEEDVERLRRILQLQRDEFLPLRVIRQELAADASPARRKRAVPLGERAEEVDLETLCERSGTAPEFVRQLEEFGLLAPRRAGREKRYAETDVEIAATCARLGAYGVEARHLRTLRSAADRSARLVETVVAPGLRSRNPERRRAALEELRTLAGLAQELSQLLFWRELHATTSP
ncbi:MAG: MerR family transcriptional regulator [Thermoleophilia bacterium]|nr:MerR family transcriptional regulator [Thermoleophilia bacterium]